MLTVNLVKYALDPANSLGDDSKKSWFVFVDHVGTSGGHLKFVWGNSGDTSTKTASETETKHKMWFFSPLKLNERLNIQNYRLPEKNLIMEWLDSEHSVGNSSVEVKSSWFLSSIELSFVSFDSSNVDWVGFSVEVLKESLEGAQVSGVGIFDFLDESWKLLFQFWLDGGSSLAKFDLVNLDLLVNTFVDLFCLKIINLLVIRWHQSF